MNFDKAFEGYEVPENIREISELICTRFNINGICDPMYVCNVTAVESGSGDGCSLFSSSEIKNHRKIAERLQSSYGCNIKRSEIGELETIIRQEEVAMFDIMKKETCIVCNKEIKINKLMYSPPVGNNNLDEGLYNEELQGYVCPKCFDKVDWNEEDIRALRHDWGWDYDDLDDDDIFDDGK